LTDVENLLDELSGRLTAVVVKYPDTQPFIESLHKHIRFALNNPREARYGKLMKKSRQWLHEMAWKHPMFRPDFMAMVDAIDKFEKQ
jgi:hypothetical protein